MDEVINMVVYQWVVVTLALVNIAATISSSLVQGLYCLCLPALLILTSV